MILTESEQLANIIAQFQQETRTVLLRIEGKVNTIMALADELNTKVATLNDYTTQLGTKIQALVDRLRDTSLSDAEKAQVLAALDAVGAGLQTDLAIGNPPPVPPEIELALKKAATAKKA